MGYWECGKGRCQGRALVLEGPFTELGKKEHIGVEEGMKSSFDACKPFSVNSSRKSGLEIQI